MRTDVEYEDDEYFNRFELETFHVNLEAVNIFAVEMTTPVNNVR